MNIVCRYRKTITINSVYELEQLVSNNSADNSETSSTHEIEITVVTLKAHPDAQTVIIVETKNGNQNADQEEKPTCLENMKHTNKEKSCHDPLQNQKEPTERAISEEENPLDEQLRGPSKELHKNLTVDQDKIHEGQDFLQMNVNFINLEESLQSSLMEKVPKSSGKTSPKVSKDEEIEKNATSKKGLQNVEEKDNQKWIIETLFTLQPFSLTKTLCSKDTETLNANRAMIFKDFLSFVEQKRLRQIYYRLHQNEVKIRKLQARVDNLCQLLDKKLNVPT